MAKLVMPKSVKLGVITVRVTILHSKVVQKKVDPRVKTMKSLITSEKCYEQFSAAFQLCNLASENWANSSPGHQDLFLPIGHNWQSCETTKI